MSPISVSDLPRAIRRPSRGLRRRLAAALIAVLGVGSSQAADDASFGNGAIAARWAFADGRLDHVVIDDKINQRQLDVTAPFVLTLADGSKLATSDLRATAAPKTLALKANPKASRFAERLKGQALQASFTDAGGRFRVDWQLVQREGSDYLREIVTVTALKQDEAIKRVDLLQSKVADAEVVGTVSGSPVVAGPTTWASSIRFPAARCTAAR